MPKAEFLEKKKSKQILGTRIEKIFCLVCITKKVITKFLFRRPSFSEVCSSDSKGRSGAKWPFLLGNACCRFYRSLSFRSN